MYVGLRGTANLKASVKPEGGRGAGNLGILPARGRQELGKAGTKEMYVPKHVCILPTSDTLINKESSYIYKSGELGGTFF